MRITGLHVDGFGLLHDQRIDDVPDGITVVLGPNEAGKSTLHAFLVRTLFGHPRANDAAGRNRLEPLRGGNHGGSVSCVDEGDGGWQVHRFTDRSPALRVVAPDGAETTNADATLELLGRAVDAGRFEQVFAIDLDDLTGVGGLGEEALDDLLFDAATVGTGRSLRAARDEAIARRDALWTPSSTKRPLALAVRARADARGALAEAQDAARRNLDVRRRLDAAVARVDELAEEQAALAARRSLLERVRDAWPTWSRRAELEATLAAWPEVVPDHEVVTVARAADDRVTQIDDELHRLRDERAVMVRRLDTITVDDVLLAAGDEITELAGRLGVHELTVEQLAAAEQAHEDARRRARDAVVELGPDWDVERVRLVPVDAATRERLVEAAERLTDATLRVETAEERAEEAARLAARREQQAYDRRLALGAPPDLDDLVEDEAAIAVLRTGVPTLAQAEVLRDARGARTADRTRRVPYPPRLRWLGTGLLAVAGALLLAGLLGVTGIEPLPVALVAVVFGGAGAFLLAGRRAPGPAVTALLDEVADDHEARDRLAEDVARAAMALGLPARPSIAEVEREAARIAAIRDEARDAEVARRTLANAVDDAVAAAETAEDLGERAEVATADRRAAAAAWSTLCTRVGLDQVDAPRAALVQHERITAAVRALGTSASAAEAARPLADRAAAFRDEAASLLATLDEPCTAEEAVRSLPGLRHRVAAAADAAATRDRLANEIEGLDERAANLRDDRAAVVAERDDALATLEVADLAALDALVARAEERRQLVAERDAATGELTRLLGDGPQGAAGRALLEQADPTAWEQELAAAAEDAASLRRTRDAALEERTELAAELERVGGDDAVARAQQTLATTETELGQLAEQWAVADAAARLLEETVARFEREQQPRVLARASALFERATGGAWREIRRIDDQVVVAHEPGGDPVAATVLSRGTREQLWLSLRLALAEDLSRERSLPLLVDDLLGTSDPARAHAVVQVLAEVARSQQVWLFTCHPATARLVTETDPTAGVIELQDGEVLGWASRARIRQRSEDVLRLDV